MGLLEGHVVDHLQEVEDGETCLVLSLGVDVEQAGEVRVQEGREVELADEVHGMPRRAVYKDVDALLDE